MMLKHFQTEALDSLCNESQLELLDAIDSLRSQGISYYVSLPQIIVCGDQSSGKSSILEAISGISFPVKGNLCTRFPTELVLRKTSYEGVNVSIVPDQSRDESQRRELSTFKVELNDLDGLPQLIESAKSAMGISPHLRAFSKDLLRIEISGPSQPHLTIVDLPGLIHSETKHQTAAEVDLVHELVQSYMKERRSIILAVVSAKNDYANQVILKLARQVDSEGLRTIGVITKPDLLPAGSDSESSYISLANNRDVEFRLGWHVLRNTDTDVTQSSLDERDLIEEQFFSQGIWQSLPDQLKGVKKLRGRLSKVLLQQIAIELPNLLEEIGNKIKNTQLDLCKLGEPRTTLPEQRLYLIRVSQSFQSLVSSAINGTYNDEFFGVANTTAGYQKRIRAVVQNLNQDFADRLRKNGHAYNIVACPSPLGEETDITRENYLQKVRRLMERTRGRELPGTFNPMIVTDLFLEQSAPWKPIVMKHINESWSAVKRFMNFACDEVSDAATSKSLFLNVFGPALKVRLDSSMQKTEDLLAPHRKSHPITYNHYFTETLQKIRNKRKEDELVKSLTKYFGELGFTSKAHLDIENLKSHLMQDTESDMSDFACSEAVDCMEAYYKVYLRPSLFTSAKNLLGCLKTLYR